MFMNIILKRIFNIHFFILYVNALTCDFQLLLEIAHLTGVLNTKSKRRFKHAFLKWYL